MLAKTNLKNFWQHLMNKSAFYYSLLKSVLKNDVAFYQAQNLKSNQ